VIGQNPASLGEFVFFHQGDFRIGKVGQLCRSPYDTQAMRHHVGGQNVDSQSGSDSSDSSRKAWAFVCDIPRLTSAVKGSKRTGLLNTWLRGQCELNGRLHLVMVCCCPD